MVILYIPVLLFQLIVDPDYLYPYPRIVLPSEIFLSKYHPHNKNTALVFLQRTNRLPYVSLSQYETI
jgi:hypothetical protein